MRGVFAVLVVVFTTGYTGAATLDKDLARCESIRDQIEDFNRGLSVEQKIVAWGNEGRLCELTEFVDFQRARLHGVAGNYQVAQGLIHKQLEASTRLRKQFLELLASHNLLQVARRKTHTAADWQDIREDYVALVRAYPDWYRGYDGLARVALLQEQYEDAEQHALQANRRRETAAAHRKLTIARYQMGNYLGAVINSTKALEMDASLNGDREFMLSSAAASIELGKLTDAQQLLDSLLKQRPQVKSDKAYRNTMKFLVARRAKKGGAVKASN